MTEEVTTQNVVQHTETIPIEIKDPGELQKRKNRMYDLALSGINLSSLKTRLGAEQIHKISDIVAEMAAECTLILGLSDNVLFFINEDGHYVFCQTGEISTRLDLLANDLLTFVSLLETHGEQSNAIYTFALGIGHELFHSYLLRFSPEIASLKIPRAGTKAYKESPIEQACERFGQRYAEWKVREKFPN